MASPALALVSDVDLIAEYRKLGEENFTLWKKALDEFRVKGEVTGETKERIEKLEAAMTELSEKMLAEFRKLNEKSSRPPVSIANGRGYGGDGEFRSIGVQFTELADYKSYQANPTNRPRFQTTLKGRIIQPMELRAVNPFIASETSGIVYIPKRVGVFTQPTIPLVMRDLLDVIPLDGTNAVEYVIEAWQLNADYQIKEGDKKAQSDVTYTDKTAVVRTIAHYVVISRQMLADAPFIQASIDNRMVYGIALKEDKEILYGDGATGHLLGIMPQATPFAGGALTIDNAIDQVYAAMVQIMQAGYAPTAIVMNPVDFAGIALMKNTMGMYLLGGPPASEATPRLWGLPIALTMNMAPGDFLVGAFPGNAALFDRQQTVVEVSSENEDNFVRNLVTIRAEERVTLAVFVPAAFVKGTVMPPAALASGHHPPAQQPSRDRK